MNKVDELIELTLKQSEMTRAIIDMMIDYNNLLKEQKEQIEQLNED